MSSSKAQAIPPLPLILHTYRHFLRNPITLVSRLRWRCSELLAKVFDTVGSLTWFCCFNKRVPVPCLGCVCGTGAISTFLRSCALLSFDASPLSCSLLPSRHSLARPASRRLLLNHVQIIRRQSTTTSRQRKLVRPRPLVPPFRGCAQRALTPSPLPSLSLPLSLHSLAMSLLPKSQQAGTNDGYGSGYQNEKYARNGQPVSFEFVVEMVPPPARVVKGDGRSGWEKRRGQEVHWRQWRTVVQ